MSFRFVQKSVTLNDLERRYFALFHRTCVYDAVVKQLPSFQYLLLKLYDYIKTICTIIQRLSG